MSFAELSDAIDRLEDAYDELWKQMEHQEYPEQRMKQLLVATSNAFVQTTRKPLSKIDFWSDAKDAAQQREPLRQAVTICDRWTLTMEKLVETFWRNYNPHPWKGQLVQSSLLTQFRKRLNEILSVRSSYDQTLRFNENQENLSAAKVFAPFAHLNALQIDAQSDAQWSAAKSQFESLMASTDRLVARQLRDHFQTIRSNPQQMLVDFKRYSDLIQRETIRRELASERELLLGQLESDVRTLTDELNNLTTGRTGGKKTITRGLNRTAIAASLDASRQIETKVNNIINDGCLLYTSPSPRD